MMNENHVLYCGDIPTKPCPDIGKILVIGGTGYIGGRLVPELLGRGYDVRVMARLFHPDFKERWPGAEVYIGDVNDLGGLREALQGVHTVFYLIHSIIYKKLNIDDIRAAQNFIKAATEKDIKRIIYLGEVGEIQDHNSEFLKSRKKVASVIQEGNIPVTILRADLIIGSGSASFEMIKNLVNKLPVLLNPKWTKNKFQPISIRDVIKFLVCTLELKATEGRSFNVMGKDTLSWKTMMEIQAKLLGKKRLFINIPFSWVALEAYLLSLFTPLSIQFTRCMIEEFKNKNTRLTNNLANLIPFRMIDYREALLRALSIEDLDYTRTRWSDAYLPDQTSAIQFHELPNPPKFNYSCSILSKNSKHTLFKTICRLGGEYGWYHSKWLWIIRGTFDKILMGVGTSRGRKYSSQLRVGDVIDFWRVEDLIIDEKLLLRAEMKLPGKAWLEFIIDKVDDDSGEKKKLTVTAYFWTNSLFGKIYWYFFAPFHVFIFNDLIRQIEKRS
ncbi:SDR family oxidoreductase [candidate division KSB1 bacterium]